MGALTQPHQEPRIDHQGYAPEIWAGLLLTSLYLLQTGPILGGISDRLETTLEIIMSAGSAICVFGAALGTRWFFPRCAKRCSYTLQLIGLPLIILSMAWYTYANASTPSLALVALGGGLGMCIEIASVRMVVEIAEELKEGVP